MDMTKTTIKLSSAEDVDELLNKHPEIKVTLTNKAAMQVARVLGDKFIEAVTQALGNCISGNYGEMITAYWGANGFVIGLSEKLRGKIRSEARNAVTIAAADDTLTETRQASREAIKEAIKAIDIQEIINDAKYEVFRYILDTVSVEIKKGILTKVEEARKATSEKNG